LEDLKSARHDAAEPAAAKAEIEFDLALRGLSKDPGTPKRYGCRSGRPAINTADQQSAEPICSGTPAARVAPLTVRSVLSEH
jgi:hypothetical protein